MVKVNLKWNGQKFDDIDVDVTQPAEVFKMQVFSLTNVPIERQKILVKGKAIGDETDLSTLGLKDGVTLMLMGTADEAIIQAPQKQTVFVEDLPMAQQFLVQTNLPAGLDNIGNTCYLNATLQCLRYVPELQTHLKGFRAPQSARGGESALVSGLQTLYSNLDSIGPATDPTLFNILFRSVFPQFQETERGYHKQQDADEAWGSLLTCLASQLKLQNQPTPNSFDNVIDSLFAIRLTSTMKCVEAPEEAAIQSEETTRKLSCHITIETNFILEGLKLSMSGNITKHSPSLGRDAQYLKTTCVSRFPPWLTVNFVRFFFKAQQNERAKILRPVKFPRVLDLIDLCSEDTQRILRKRRAKVSEEKDAAQKRKEEQEKASSSTTTTTTTVATTTTDVAMETEEIIPDPGFTAVYELKAVLTHVGRTLDGGHYIAWVHRHGDEWLKFDDKVVTPCTYDEDIVKLCGGGDWHTAYLCLYQEIKQ